jgi:transaldolase
LANQSFFVFLSKNIAFAFVSKPHYFCMKFFIDTANLAEIQEAYDLGVLDGVTTNPSLMAKEGVTGKQNILEHYLKICNIVEGDVSAEVVATDFAGIVREGEELAALHKNIVVKVPMIKDGVKAIKYFSQKGIKTNCTLVFSAGQAILAAKAGATYVSPFIGRLDDVSTDGLALIEQMVQIYQNYNFGTQILAASVRHVMHLVQCAEIGADVVTCPLNVITGLLKHPLTDIGLEKFLADYKKGNS